MAVHAFDKPATWGRTIPLVGRSGSMSGNMLLGHAQRRQRASARM